MAAEAEREFLKTVGKQSDEWSKKVDKMSDEQAIAVYLTSKDVLDKKKAEGES